MKKGFTILEIVIILAILVILATIGIALMNPVVQINKANDGRRKGELATMGRILEDFLNDKGRYPRPSEICYDAGNYIPESGTTTCHMCGSNAASPNLAPYLGTLPCDPQTPKSNYIYEVNDEDEPTLYRIYSRLAITSDPLISQLGCQNGCGPYGICQYNYGVSSSNTGIQTCTALAPTASPTPTPVTVGPCSNYNPLYINVFQEGQWKCNICGTYAECKATYPALNYYIDQSGGINPDCTQMCFKD